MFFGKKISVTYLFFNLIFVSFAQLPNSNFSDNKSDFSQFMNSSSVLLRDSICKASVQPLALQFWAGGSKASIGINDLLHIGPAFVREKILGTDNLATGWVGATINGPSAIFSIKNKYTIGVSTRSRFFANFWNMDGQFLSEIEEYEKTPHSYPYSLVSGNSMMVNAAAWSELGVSFSTVLIKNDRDLLTTGLTVKYVAGLSHASIDAHIDHGRVEGVPGSYSYLTAASGNISTQTSGSLFNNISVQNLFSTGRSNIGGDIGISYEIHPLGQHKPYKFKMDISVTDIGKLTFIPNQNYSKNYNLDIPDGRPLYLTGNLGETPFNQITTIFDNNSSDFKQTAVHSNIYSVSLPTALNVTADYNFTNKFYLGTFLKLGLQSSRSVSDMYVYNSITLTPRYLTKNFTIGIPIIYQQYTGFNVGLRANYGCMVFESGSILSSTFTKTKQTDFYLGVHTWIKSKKRKNVAILNTKPIYADDAYSNIIMGYDFDIKNKIDLLEINKMPIEEKSDIKNISFVQETDAFSKSDQLILKYNAGFDLLKKIDNGYNESPNYPLDNQKKEVDVNFNTALDNRAAPNTSLTLNQLHGFTEIHAIGTTKNTIPFWMRSNQFGSIPLNGLSTSVIAGVSKEYDTLRKGKLLDWGGGLEFRGNIGSQIEGVLLEGYLKGRLSIFQLKVGRSKDIVGFVDSSLSVGAFAVSGNALGIPKIELSIPAWYMPFTNKMFAIKGTFVHGWFGQTPLRTNSSTTYLVNSVNSYYHQFSVYGKLGKANWKVKFIGGLNHEVMWGHEKEMYGSGFKLNGLNEYWHILTGTSDGVGNSKIGNNIGSIDQGIEINLKKYNITGYHQFFYDIGALGHLSNINDGLWGVSVKNTIKRKNILYWNKILLEFLFSKNQAGAPDSKPTTSGSEDYYNNYLYKQGWSYKNQNIGIPLLTNIFYARKGFPQHLDDFIINNRVTAINLGFDFAIKKWDIISKLTYSENFGTWNTAPATRVGGSRVQYNPPPYFEQVNQFSSYIAISTPIKNGYRISGVFALDAGQLLYNSTGFILKLSKVW